MENKVSRFTIEVELHRACIFDNLILALIFSITGLDWGGLRREWIELLCLAIFDHRQSGMFTSFSDSNEAQALVHPNPNAPVDFKLKHYEFAGKLVGKCLFESSLGIISFSI